MIGLSSPRKGIPTTFAYSNFRSRLEARWAAFFDLIGWRWTYEPLDVSGYIPDFLIHGKRPFFVEVGPCVTETDYMAKSVKADRVAGELGRDVLIVGVSPIADWDSRNFPSRRNGYQVAGWFGEILDGRHFDSHDTDCDPETINCPHMRFAWETGIWAQCFDCREVGVTHAEMSYYPRPCGHHQSGSWGEVVDQEGLERLWREAGNAVQWRR